MRIRIVGLSAALLLAALSLAFAAPRIATATFTPAPETGNIFTVINFARAGGRAQGTFVTVLIGDTRRDFAVAPAYRGTCATTTPAGFVLRTRHPRPDTIPITILTSGTIVRGPYQGDLPLELLSPCYKIVT
jgi:hypothetical protein